MLRVHYKTYDGTHWGELEGGDVHVLTSMLGRRTGEVVPLSDVSLLPPAEPRTIICVGKNYAKHIAEMGGDAQSLPSEPGLFLKSLGTLAGPGDAIVYPRWTENLHYEGELAVVIGRELKQASPEDALDAVLGYTCAIDVTARDKQRSDLQWARGKSADRFCPLGPWLETDLDPTSVQVQTYVNGELRQDGNTEDLIFPVADILSYISQFLTLVPGDVVLTGTPDGVGPMHVGDEIEVRIEGIGSLTAPVVAP